MQGDTPRGTGSVAQRISLTPRRTRPLSPLKGVSQDKDGRLRQPDRRRLGSAARNVGRAVNRFRNVPLSRGTNEERQRRVRGINHEARTQQHPPGSQTRPSPLKGGPPQDKDGRHHQPIHHTMQGDVPLSRGTATRFRQPTRRRLASVPSSRWVRET
jgi:hypothetical protein